MGYLISQSFATRRNLLYLDFWAGGWSHSLDRRQNRYSYVTIDTVAGFGVKALGLKPPWS
jgi:hypothetical protein